MLMSDVLGQKRTCSALLPTAGLCQPGRSERNRAARSFRQLRRFHHVINSHKLLGTHKGMSWKDAELQIRGCLQRQGVPPEGIAKQLKLSQPLFQRWLD